MKKVFQTLATWSLAACLSASAQVSFDRILAAEREPGNWLTYSGNYSAHRHSTLEQIHAGNVQKMKPVWVYQTSAVAPVETTPTLNGFVGPAGHTRVNGSAGLIPGFQAVAAPVLASSAVRKERDCPPMLVNCPAT